MDESDAETADPRWKGLYRVGGAAALITVALIPIQMFIFIAWPPPDTVTGWFALFQGNRLLGLLNMDLLYMLSNVLVGLVYLALYVALKRAGESAVAIALTLGLLGIAAYFASNPAFEMLSLSERYAAATTDAEGIVFLAAGEAMLATYEGTAFDVYYVLSAVALLMFSAAMLRSEVFNRATAYVGLLAGLFMVIPSTAGTIGLIFSIASLAPWAIFSVLVARRLFQLGRAS